MKNSDVSTPITEHYTQLTKIGSRESRLARAVKLAADPAEVARDFRASIAAFGSYQPRDEGFYGSRASHHDGVKNKTALYARRVREAGGLKPTDPKPTNRAVARDEDVLEFGVRRIPATDLACEYLDRELVPTRTTKGPRPPDAGIRLDLLLVNSADRVPIVGEVKLTADDVPGKSHLVPSTDKDAFSALMQALACTAQLATPAQYARLARWGRAEQSDEGDRPVAANLAPGDPPTFDVYVVLHNRPQGAFLRELGDEAERLAAKLLAEPAVARHVRRIACIVTALNGETLTAEADWAYGRATPT